MKVIKLTSIALFALYWGVTLFFNTPNNYLKINALEYENIFSTFFYQKWSFFAPPPKDNNRLYYHYYSKDDEVISFEALSELQEKRSNQFFFNEDLSVLDNIISNCIIGINNNNRKNYELYKTKRCDSINDTECYKLFSEDLEEINSNNESEIATLCNYGKIIHTKNMVSENFDQFTISITSKPILKFADRFSKKETEEKLLFRSKMFKIN